MERRIEEGQKQYEEKIENLQEQLDQCRSEIQWLKSTKPAKLKKLPGVSVSSLKTLMNQVKTNNVLKMY